MIILALIIIAAGITAFFKLAYISAGLCAAGLIMLLYISMRKKTIEHSGMYVLSSNAVSNNMLRNIIESGIIRGRFLISTVLIDKLVNDTKKGKKNFYNTIKMDNISFIQMNADMSKIECDYKIPSLFKYAYENGATVILSGESVSKNISKLFNVRTIDISRIKTDRSDTYRTGEKIRFVIERLDNGRCSGRLIDRTLVYSDCSESAVQNSICEGYVDSVITIDNQRVIITKKEYERH